MILIGRRLSLFRPTLLGMNTLSYNHATRLDAQMFNTCTNTFVKRAGIQISNIKKYCSPGNSDISNEGKIELNEVGPSEYTFLKFASTMEPSLNSLPEAKTLETVSVKKQYS